MLARLSYDPIPCCKRTNVSTTLLDFYCVGGHKLKLKHCARQKAMDNF